MLFSSIIQIPGESTLKRNFALIQQGEGRRTPNPLIQPPAPPWGAADPSPRQQQAQQKHQGQQQHHQRNANQFHQQQQHRQGDHRGHVAHDRGHGPHDRGHHQQQPPRNQQIQVLTPFWILVNLKM